jgi:hypothetical protein
MEKLWEKKNCFSILTSVQLQNVREIICLALCAILAIAVFVGPAVFVGECEFAKNVAIHFARFALKGSIVTV